MPIHPPGSPRADLDAVGTIGGVGKSSQRQCDGPGETPGSQCDRLASWTGNAPSRLCCGHLKQRQRGEQLKPLRAYETARARLEAAALALSDVDADDDEAYERAQDRLEKAADAFGKRRRRYRRRGSQDVVLPRDDSRVRGSPAGH